MDFSARSLARSIVLAVGLTASLASSAWAISPSFDPPAALDIAGNASSVAVGDFDGDGRKDLAAAYGLRPRSGLGLVGHGRPGRRVRAPVPGRGSGRAAGALVVRDLNGDGRDDVAVANAGPQGDAAMTTCRSCSAVRAASSGARR